MGCRGRCPFLVITFVLTNSLFLASAVVFFVVLVVYFDEVGSKTLGTTERLVVVSVNLSACLIFVSNAVGGYFSCYRKNLRGIVVYMVLCALGTAAPVAIIFLLRIDEKDEDYQANNVVAAMACTMFATSVIGLYNGFTIQVRLEYAIRYQWRRRPSIEEVRDHATLKSKQRSPASKDALRDKDSTKAGSAKKAQLKNAIETEDAP